MVPLSLRQCSGIASRLPAMIRTRTLFYTFLVAVQVCALGASVVSHGTRPQGLIASDGKGYYAWLRSLALDGDMNFRNDYELLYPPDPIPDERLTPRGLVANKYPVGLALTELPGFAVGHALARMTGQPANGVSTPYQFAVTGWLQLLCVAGLAFLFHACVRMGADPRLAGIAVASTLTATNLVQYVARPAMSHGPGLAILSIALYVAVLAREPGEERWKLVAIGSLLGLATIVRPSNVALAPLFAVLLMPTLGRSAARWALLIGPYVCVVALQVTMMSLSWGQLTFSGYHGEGFTAGLTGIGGTLLSARHGLFVYHPWYLLALILTAGALTNRRSRPLAAAGLASFVILTIVNGTWWSWWFGDGFGNRAFIEVIPALLVPSVIWLSAVGDATRRIVVPAVVLCLLSAVNGLLWSGFILRRYPADGHHRVADAYLWPWRS